MKINQSLVFGVTFLSLFALGIAGCGSSGGSGDDSSSGSGTDDSTVEASETDALDSGTAAEGAALAAVNASIGGGGSLLMLPSSRSSISDLIKHAITITSTSTCAEGGVPSPSGDLFDDSFDGSVTGSCTVTADGASTDLSLVADCANFNDGDTTEGATLDGAIGVEATIDTGGGGFDYELTIGSQDLEITLSGGDNCSLDVNLTATISVDNMGSGTVAIEGCVTVCGEGFEATGSETF